jgi:glycosyltransferase involved in cell wall biosynthesis
MKFPERRLSRTQPRWVFDFDDAVFFENVSTANRAFVRLKPFDQPARLVAGARAVSAGNAWLAEWARRQRPGSTPDDVQVIPTAVDTDRWAPRAKRPGPPRLVWIGSPSTVPYLRAIEAPLKRVSRAHPELELHVIGTPFAASDWSRGKCGLKLLLYMSLGLATVASPHGVQSTIVTDGEHGMIAATSEDFESAVMNLLGDPGLRARLGAAARARVEADYSVRAIAPRLAALLRRAAEAR